MASDLVGTGPGFECSGTVREIVHNDQNLKIGDRIATFSSDVLFTQPKASEGLCMRTPDELNFEEAVTVALVYSTVIHSFIDKEKVAKHQVSLARP